MSFISDLLPGKRDNAYFLNNNVKDSERMGMQSRRNKRRYIYEWDAQRKRHVGRWIAMK